MSKSSIVPFDVFSYLVQHVYERFEITPKKIGLEPLKMLFYIVFNLLHDVQELF